MASLFTFTVFARNLLRVSRQRETFRGNFNFFLRIFARNLVTGSRCYFKCLDFRGLNRGLMSNKPNTIPTRLRKLLNVAACHIGYSLRAV